MIIMNQQGFRRLFKCLFHPWGPCRFDPILTHDHPIAKARQPLHLLPPKRCVPAVSLDIHHHWTNQVWCVLSIFSPVCSWHDVSSCFLLGCISRCSICQLISQIWSILPINLRPEAPAAPRARVAPAQLPQLRRCHQSPWGAPIIQRILEPCGWTTLDRHRFSQHGSVVQFGCRVGIYIQTTPALPQCVQYEYSSLNR